MATNNPTEGVYYYDDTATKTVYKITYYKGTNEFRIFKQFHDDEGKYRRFTIKKKNIINYDDDLQELIQYIKTELVGEKEMVSQKVEESEKLDDEEGWMDPEEYARHRKRAKAKRNNKRVQPEHEEATTQKRVDTSVFNAEAFEMSCGQESEALERLFVEWEKAQENEPEQSWKKTNGGNVNIGKSHFRRDGIIDENVFLNEQVKVLFISAEANDNEYSARHFEKMDTVLDYREFHRKGVDDWKGKMRERLAEIYKVICGIGRSSMTNQEAVLHFAVMDINKRGGGSQIKDGKHIEAYCRYYAEFIRKEIEVIDPDIVAIIGINLFNLDLHKKYLGAIRKSGKDYFVLNGKQVPILSLWQTAYYQGKNKPLRGYEDNKIIGKQAARCVEELKRFGIM